jgi:CheY-like chemotaxis protein
MIANTERMSKLVRRYLISYQMEITSQILKRLGYPHIDVAHDGVEAVQMSGEKTYDIILMDVSMPRLNGLDATVEYALR